MFIVRQALQQQAAELLNAQAATSGNPQAEGEKLEEDRSAGDKP
jgi:hypothetical protein